MKRIVFWRKDDSGQEHLRFVISDPDEDNRVMTVNMTKVYGTGREDLSCILFPGDHRCITYKSYIRYDLALDLECKKLLNENFSGNIRMEEDASEETLLKIQEGARNSDALPEKFKPFFDYF